MTRLFEEALLRSRPRRSCLSLPASLALHGAGIVLVLALQLFAPLELPESAPAGALIYRLPIEPAVVHAAPRPVVAPSRARGSSPSRAAVAPSLQPASQSAPSVVPDGLPTSEVAPFDDDLPFGPGCSGAHCAAGLAGASGDVVGQPHGVDAGSGADRTFVAGREVSPPLKVHDVRPAYPELALRLRVQGSVSVVCTIAPDGHVVGLRAESGPPLLREAALAAVRAWRYRPTLVSGTPVAVLLTVTVNFRLAR